MADIVGLPCDIILIRHGESEGNLAHAFEDLGDASVKALISEKTIYDLRLTRKGRRQADVTGEWIRKHIDNRFDKYYTSDLLRAKETAARLGFEHAMWYCETDVREQYLTDDDTHNELGSALARSIAVENFIDSLIRSSGGLRIIVVCHATTIRSFMIRLEKLQYRDLSHVEDDQDLTIHNCQVVWYSRRDPLDGRIDAELSFKTTVVPWNTPNITTTDLQWKKISRRTFSNIDLFVDVESKSSLILDKEEAEYKEKIEALKQQRQTSVIGDLLNLDPKPITSIDSRMWDLL